MPCLWECTYRCTTTAGLEVESIVVQKNRCGEQISDPQLGECVLVKERQIPDDGTSDGLLGAALGAVAGAVVGGFVTGGNPLGVLALALIGAGGGFLGGQAKGRCP